MEEIQLENVEEHKLKLSEPKHVEPYKYSDDHEVPEEKRWKFKFSLNFKNWKFTGFKLFFNIKF